MGRSDGNIQYSRALRVILMPGACSHLRLLRTLPPERCVLPAPADLVRIRPAVWGFCIRPVRAELREKWLRSPAASSTRKGAAGALRRDRNACASPAALRSLTILIVRKPREDARRLGRNQPRDQSRNPPYERSCPVGRDRRVEFAPLVTSRWHR